MKSVFLAKAKKTQVDPPQVDLLNKSLATNLERFKNDFFVADKTIMYREFRTPEPNSRQGVLIYADNMAKHDYLSQYVVAPLIKNALPPKLSGQNLADYVMERIVQSDGVDPHTDFLQLVDAVVGGAGVVLLENCDVGIAIDAQGWEKRQVEEPPSENVVRGPRQGFTEDLMVNTSLMRRKNKSHTLKTKFLQLGTETKTKLAIIYVQDVASSKLVQDVIERVEQITIDAVLKSAYIKAFINDAPFSPFPTIGSTERPDVVAAKILEGRVAILVGGTPFALTMPLLFLESLQANEDYYHHWPQASIKRLLRYLCFFLTVFTPAVYISLANYHPQLLPAELVLSISAARTNTPFPAVVEAAGMLFVFEILREGGVRLPKPVSQAISIIGAIVIGDAAVSANLVSAPMLIVIGVTAVAGFVVPQFQGVTIFIRLIALIMGAILGLYGVVFVAIGLLLQLSAMESFGVPYLSNLTSYSAEHSKDTVLRAPWWLMQKRPAVLTRKNRVRLRSEKP